MIYTVGRADIYEDYIKNDKNAAKRKGGSVWETFKDAQHCCNENNDMITSQHTFQIYGVDADWESDTEVEQNVRYRSLKRDAKLIKIRLLNDIFHWVKETK